ncbi:MAG: SGNH/GDSL hydrolase family protein [Pseudomonadales bacterium]|jgi:hypothetical protein
MRGGWVRAGGNLLLLGVSLLLTLAVLEACLRLFLDPENLLPDAPEHVDLAEKRNALKFYAQNRERDPDALGSFDPWLGWDASYGATRARGMTKLPPAPGLRAVAVGDSFVYGNEVAADENFTALLDAANNGVQALNLGVPGYGLDQSFLKLERYGAPLDPDIVLFGIYVSDYERATLRFTYRAKPRFEQRGGRMIIANQPVPGPAESLQRIARDLSGTSYLLEMARSRLVALEDVHTAFFETGDRIARHVLASLARSIRPPQRLLIVHIPRGESFTNPDPFHAAMSGHLQSLYRETSVPVVDLGRAFLADTSPEHVAHRFYVVRDSGSIGHLSAEGHRRAAAAIADALGIPF